MATRRDRPPPGYPLENAGEATGVTGRCIWRAFGRSRIAQEAVARGSVLRCLSGPHEPCGFRSSRPTSPCAEDGPRAQHTYRRQTTCDHAEQASLYRPIGRGSRSSTDHAARPRRPLISSDPERHSTYTSAQGGTLFADPSWTLGAQACSSPRNSSPAWRHAFRGRASNAAGKPFVWTKSADEILASIARFGLNAPWSCITD